MSQSLPDFARLFRDRTALAAHRASSELRAGRPILVDAPDGSAVVAALDTASPALFSVFAENESATLCLSTARARMLGIQGAIKTALPSRLDQAIRLAMGTQVAPPELRVPAGGAAAAGIALCRSARLLPALLFAPAAGGFARPEGMVAISTAEIAADTAAERPEVEIVSRAQVPLAAGVEAQFIVFRGGGERDQLAMVVGAPDPEKPVLVRMHSACLTGDLFGSLRCDCGDQLHRSIAGMAAEGGGVLLYLDQEGRGIGLCNKMRAYAIQDEGFDTNQANALLGFEADERRYDLAVAILAALDVRRVRLMTNNPDKVDRLRRAGIDVVVRRPLLGTVTAQNRDYLVTKARCSGHMLDAIEADYDLPAVARRPR